MRGIPLTTSHSAILTEDPYRFDMSIHIKCGFHDIITNKYNL